MVESSHKPKKTRVDQKSKFYNRLMKLWLRNSEIKMYSLHKGNYVVSKRFLRDYKIKKGLINKMDEKVKKHSKTYHITKKMNTVYVHPRTYIKYSVEHNYKQPEFKADNCVKN